MAVTRSKQARFKIKTIATVVGAFLGLAKGILVKWLWQETHVLKVMGSNPSTVHILHGHFSQLIVAKIVFMFG